MRGDEGKERDAIEPASDRSGSKFPTFLEAGYAPVAVVASREHIVKMLPKFSNWFGRKDKPTTPSQVLEVGDQAEPADRDLTRLVPVIVPLELLNAGWPGPIAQIGTLPFCIAWATCGEMNTFFYVTHREAQFWETAGIDWQAIAMENLSEMSAERPASGQKLDSAGVPFIKVMLHDDAVGPSRLLLPHLFENALGPDYRVAIPERTCAVAYRRKLLPQEAADVEGMINGCFEHGTEPMSPERFEADSFWGLAEAAVRS